MIPGRWGIGLCQITSQLLIHSLSVRATLHLNDRPHLRSSVPFFEWGQCGGFSPRRQNRPLDYFVSAPLAHTNGSFWFDRRARYRISRFGSSDPAVFTPSLTGTEPGERPLELLHPVTPVYPTNDLMSLLSFFSPNKSFHWDPLDSAAGSTVYLCEGTRTTASKNGKLDETREANKDCIWGFLKRHSKKIFAN